MATQKHLKLKEDEHRLFVKNGITAMLAAQLKMTEAFERLTTQLEKEKPSVKAKTVRK